MPSHRPEMTRAGLPATETVTARDEYQNTRELQIANERPLTIYLDRQEVVTLMTLGTQPELLALGYLKNQGLVDEIAAIKSIQVDWDVNAAVITTYDENTDWLEKTKSRTITSGCGQGTVFGNVMEQLASIHLPARQIKQSSIYDLLRNLATYNDVYKSAGAVHGCALCNDVNIEIFIEDVGRHNAVDAIAGHMWLENIHSDDKLFYTTGRLTSEMIIKVALMGIPILLSRSGITQMGLELARTTGVTLLSRAKGQHFLVYTGAENIIFDVDLPEKKHIANVIT